METKIIGTHKKTILDRLELPKVCGGTLIKEDNLHRNTHTALKYIIRCEDCGKWWETNRCG